jgi:hypothetical protein
MHRPESLPTNAWAPVRFWLDIAESYKQVNQVFMQSLRKFMGDNQNRMVSVDDFQKGVFKSLLAVAAAKELATTTIKHALSVDWATGSDCTGYIRPDNPLTILSIVDGKIMQENGS